MTVITPSFAPDFELCRGLNRSVLDNSAENVLHHIIVPRKDIGLFTQLANTRTHIRPEDDLLPRSFIRLRYSKFTINFAQPFPPVRGWMLQQIVKLAAAAESRDDVVLLVDSDIEFVRAFSAETFVRNNVVRFYKKPRAVDERLPRHIVWHRAARELLGLPESPPPYADYISSLLAWDPRIVRQLLSRVSQIAKRPWATAISGRLHFSEWTLYGVFVSEVLGTAATSFESDDPLCHAYWDPVPLTSEQANVFLQGIGRDDVAAMISAKSRTSLAVRKAALSAYRAAGGRDENSG